MSTFSKVVSITVGVVAIIWAYLPGGTFYPGALGIVDRTKPIPKWFGRVWFTVLGLWSIYTGFGGGTAQLVEKIVAVGIGVTVIIAGFAARRSHASALSMTGGNTIAPVPKPFGGFLFLVVGLLFILAGLALKR
ncbi:MAG TPA: hypothetical protein VKQ28_09945 [Candidatus Acidoferrum sp.]|nr:hypothetical protein [Candidatus Acidoferrum sp.]